MTNPKGKRYTVADDGRVTVMDRPTPPPTPVVLAPLPAPYPTHPNGRPIGHYL